MKYSMGTKRLIILLVILVVLFLGIELGPSIISNFPAFVKNPTASILPNTSNEKVKVVTEESVVTSTVKNVGPSVITIGINQSPQSNSNDFNNNDFGPFSLFFGQNPDDQQQPAPSPDQSDQYIGSGFVASSDGLIVTNKHVVSDTSSTYFVVDQNGDKYDVTQIYRDPLNDIAILKTKKTPTGGFRPVVMGDSSNLQVGQFVIAIGTALGEFRNTVTTGVISGLGRGITAGSPLEGSVEQLDNVIQTDAAINPGNSGGPLLNSSGQVIGINTAVSTQGQNIGFAIPISVVKDTLNNFNKTGQFNRPFLGVAYSMIDKQAALLNDAPQGALVQEVVPGSSADKAGIQVNDIITSIDGQKLSDTGDNTLASIISKDKVGQTITVSVYRDNKSQDIKVTLQTAPENTSQ
jgi:S1-C subfamily serine protease